MKHKFEAITPAPARKMYRAYPSGDVDNHKKFFIKFLQSFWKTFRGEISIFTLSSPTGAVGSPYVHYFHIAHVH